MNTFTKSVHERPTASLHIIGNTPPKTRAPVIVRLPPPPPFLSLHFFPVISSETLVLVLDSEDLESSPEMTKKGGDIEAGYGGGSALYPNMMESPQLRWAFIRKVYTIVALQIVITIGVAAAINLIAPVRDFLLDRSTASFAAGVAIMILPFLGTYVKFQDRLDSFSSPIPCSMTALLPIAPLLKWNSNASDDVLQRAPPNQLCPPRPLHRLHRLRCWIGMHDSRR